MNKKGICILNAQQLVVPFITDERFSYESHGTQLNKSLLQAIEST